eukprot:scaffold10960_cov115-Isochrysis_galbana.AAC.1
MERTPADARAAPSASAPTDMVTETPPSPKRPRDPSFDNKVSQSATTFDPVWKNTTPRARGGVTMAPLQLRLEPTEVVSAMDKGAARVRVDSTDESSLQV